METSITKDQISNDANIHESVVSSRFVIKKCLAESGTSRVYLANDTLFSSPVVLKFIHKHLIDDPNTHAIAIREAKLSKQLYHPGVIKVYDLRKHKGEHYLVMEYVKGESLSVLQTRMRFDYNYLMVVLAPLVEALNYLHRSGVVHSDIKPSNIIVTPSGQIKIIDLANCRQDSLSKKPRVLISDDCFFGYSLDYSSPQVVNDERATTSDDVFSLACVVYELLEGTSPIAAEKSKSSLVASVKKPGAITGPQWRVMQKALSEDDKQRYHSVNEFFQDFQRARHVIPRRVSYFVAFCIVFGLSMMGWQKFTDFSQKAAKYRHFYENSQAAESVEKSIVEHLPLERYKYLDAVSSLPSEKHQSVLSSLYQPVVLPIIYEVDKQLLSVGSVPNFDVLEQKIASLQRFYTNDPQLEALSIKLSEEKTSLINGFYVDLSNILSAQEFNPSAAVEFLSVYKKLQLLGASTELVSPTSSQLSHYADYVQELSDGSDWILLEESYEFARILSAILPDYLAQWSPQGIQYARDVKRMNAYILNETHNDPFPQDVFERLMGEELYQLETVSDQGWLNKDIFNNVDKWLAIKEKYRVPDNFLPLIKIKRILLDKINAKVQFHLNRNQVVAAGKLTALLNKLS